MGMIKTAVRYGLIYRRPLAKLLDDVNRVLPSVSAPNMFATLAALRFDALNEVEYISAGHVPLLHYQRQPGPSSVTTCPNFHWACSPAPVTRHGASDMKPGTFLCWSPTA